MRRMLGVLLLIAGLATGGLTTDVRDHLAPHAALAQTAEESEVQPAAEPESETAGEPVASIPGEVVEVLVRDDRFTESRLTIAVGTTVTWVHKGHNLHTISAVDGMWDSGTVQHGESFSFTFDRPGTYAYFCRQHLLQGMRGTITVEAPAPAETPATTEAPVTDEAAITAEAP